MRHHKKQFELSSRMRAGVNRSSKTQNSKNILKFLSYSMLVIAGALIIHTGYVLYSDQTPSPEVLGASQDNSQVDFITHTVDSGETLFTIAEKYKIPWSAIAVLNNLSTPNLSKNQILKIPKQ